MFVVVVLRCSAFSSFPRGPQLAPKDRRGVGAEEEAVPGGGGPGPGPVGPVFAVRVDAAEVAAVGVAAGGVAGLRELIAHVLEEVVTAAVAALWRENRRNDDLVRAVSPEARERGFKPRTVTVLASSFPLYDQQF